MDIVYYSTSAINSRFGIFDSGIIVSVQVRLQRKRRDSHSFLASSTVGRRVVSAVI